MARIDRTWFESETEVVTVEQKTKAALDRIIDESGRRAKEQRAERNRKRLKVIDGPVYIEKYYSVAYWAEMLGVSQDTIRELCKADEIHAEKIRGGWRICETAVKDYLLKQRAKRA